MRKTLVFALSALLFVIMISTPATAQTPDSVSPQEQASQTAR